MTISQFRRSAVMSICFVGSKVIGLQSTQPHSPAKMTIYIAKSQETVTHGIEQTNTQGNGNDNAVQSRLGALNAPNPAKYTVDRRFTHSCASEICANNRPDSHHQYAGLRSTQHTRTLLSPLTGTKRIYGEYPASL